MISGITVNYRSSRLLRQSVQKIMKFLDEIIVVNHSPEEDLTDLQSFSPKVKIYNRKNSGYASGCNFGARMAKGDILLFFNPDTQVFEDTIPFLFEILKKDSCAAVAPVFLNPDGTFQPSTRKFPELVHLFVSRTSPIGTLLSGSKTSKKYFGLDLHLQSDPVQLTDRFPLGGFFMIPRNLFFRLSGFDQRFFLFFEDTDFFYRLLESGFKIILDPRAKIIHFHGSSRKSNPFKAEFHKLKSMVLYFMKHNRNYLLMFSVSFIALVYCLILAFRYFINIPVKEKQWAST